MSINRGLDKEDMVHIYNGILLSHKKGRNLAICRDMDQPRVCRTEQSKSEREKQISYINMEHRYYREDCRSHLGDPEEGRRLPRTGS